MASIAETKKVGFVESHRVELVTIGSTLMVGAASAATIDINATVGPILDSVITLIPTIINLIIAIVPAILVMAVVGFIVAFFEKILQMIKL
jgi:uncharacterized protein YaaW (UPF0174 family)